MEDECELDTLTALLDDSDMEEDAPKPTVETNNKAPEDKDGCDIDELTAFLEESDNEVEDENQNFTEQNGSNDKCNADEIASFLEQSDSENEFEEDGDNVEKEEEEKEQDQEDKNEEVNNIQAELMEMQRKMLELQQRLAKSQTDTEKIQKSPCLKNKNKTIKEKPNTNKDSSKISTLNKEDSQNFKNKDHKEKHKIHSPKNLEKQKMEKSPVSSNSQKKDRVKTQKDETGSSQKPTKVSDMKLLDSEENPFFPSKEDKNCSSERAKLEKDLFGDDDNSDFEPMDEEEKVKLTDEGQELRKMIRDHGKPRQSNVTSDQVEEMRKKAQRSHWKAKGIPVTSPLTSKSTKENEIPSVMDPFSGIRIVNPKISSIEMKERMRDRKLVKISKIDRRVSEHDNWVTIGVIVSKTEPRQSTTGKTYCLWKLSDLQDCDKTISFFLFGDVYKTHWKNEVTSVVGILNPNLMDKAEKVQNDLAFTVNHQAQVMLMGYSKDFGRCSAMTGKGNNTGKHCTNFINKQHGEYCTYHVQRAYSKTCSKRTELQGSYSGMTPKNHKYKPKDNKDGFFFYQGQTYTTGKMPNNQSNKKKVTVDKLKQQQAFLGTGKVTTMSLHSIDPADVKMLKKLENPKTESNSLLDMLTVPSPGSMNFVKHLVAKDKKVEPSPVTGKPMIQSITAADLLKQHKQAMRQRKQTNAMSGPPCDPLKSMPTLGRGLSPGGDICLDVSSGKVDRAKLKALAQVRSKGGITKTDPNAVRKNTSPEARAKLKKRVLENDQPPEEVNEPPKKRSKLLGNIDENSEEFKRLMKETSKHKGVIAEVEAEVEEKYFMEQEKKERLEDKMASIKELKVIVFTCKQCNYTARKLKDECKEKNHPTVKLDAFQRFFKCKKCNHRTISIHKLPLDSCKNCGENNFERVSMLSERKGPKLPHENLCIRGDEIKFLGSMNEKVHLP